jgi:hypothetical protein
MENSTLQIFKSTAISDSTGVIPAKPLCDYFGLQYDNQVKKIKSSELLKTSTLKITSKLQFGDERERLSLTKQGFITWILQINPQILQVSLRERLLNYQRFIFDFMFG